MQNLGGLMVDEIDYKKAKQRAEAKLGFYIHGFVFMVVNIGLITFNLYLQNGGSGYFWAKWPLLGWSIGLAMHGLGVFVFNGSSLENLRERMIQKELKKRY